MGLGDDIIFLAKAEEVYKETGKKIVPLYHAGLNVLYDNVEFIAKTKDENSLTMNARDTNEPSDIHIDYYTKGREQTILGERMIWRPFKPSRYAVRLTESEIKTASKLVPDNFVLINPDYKSSFFSTNKNWGFKKYQELANRLSKDIPVVRVKPAGKYAKRSNYSEPYLENAINIKGEDLRQSIAIMSKAKFGVTSHGFITHILSGFNIPVVDIQGGHTDTSSMYYENNIAIGYDHPKTPCGATYPCTHCDEANKYITVDMVYEACKKLL